MDRSLIWTVTLLLSLPGFSVWAGPDAQPPDEGKTSGKAVSHVLERHAYRHRAWAATRQHKQQHMSLTESMATCRQSGYRSKPPPGLEGSSSLPTPRRPDSTSPTSPDPAPPSCRLICWCLMLTEEFAGKNLLFTHLFSIFPPLRRELLVISKNILIGNFLPIKAKSSIHEIWDLANLMNSL